MAENSEPIRPNVTERSGVPVAPSLQPALIDADVTTSARLIDFRGVYITVLAVIVGALGGLIAEALIWLIAVITNVSFTGKFDGTRGINFIVPVTHPQPWMILIPVAGGIVIGFMARFGSRAVAGHGIPEAMEQVLTNESRIPPRLTFLKPVSAAISIGTGAPYGAEGPIIATGGAIGSLLGQLLSTTSSERKILLAAGASAGICAAFNCPIAAVLLAVELLLFEFRPRSLIPVAAASIVASGLHIWFDGTKPFFTFGNNVITMPSQSAVGMYLLIGCIVGVGSVILTRTVMWIEHFFEHLPIHWMWHPAIGAIFVGVIGYYYPKTFGSGYFNIDDLLSNHLALGAIAVLGIMKFLSWTISLGSGTAGGTLAPVFTIGGTLGGVAGIIAARWFPELHLNIGIAALVGMVGIFAGASRALLTSVVFAIETTMQPAIIVPALGGCTMAYLVSCLLMRHSIMTEKMVRRGVRVPEEYQPDFLDSVQVNEMMTRKLVNLRDNQTVGEVRQNLASDGEFNHQGFPVVDASGLLLGVITRRDLLRDVAPQTRLGELIRRPPVVIYDDLTLRDAASQMARHEIGRLPVIQRSTSNLVGILTRSDILSAHRRRQQVPARSIQLFARNNGGRV